MRRHGQNAGQCNGDGMPDETVTRELLLAVRDRISAAYGFCPLDDRSMRSMLATCGDMLLHFLRIDECEAGEFDFEDARAYLGFSYLALREFESRRKNRPVPTIHLLRDGAETWCNVLVGMFDLQTWTRQPDETN